MGECFLDKPERKVKRKGHSNKKNPKNSLQIGDNTYSTHIIGRMENGKIINVPILTPRKPIMKDGSLDLFKVTENIMDNSLLTISKKITKLTKKEREITRSLALNSPEIDKKQRKSLDKLKSMLEKELKRREKKKKLKSRLKKKKR
jgi:hypothetical protein